MTTTTPDALGVDTLPEFPEDAAFPDRVWVLDFKDGTFGSWVIRPETDNIQGLACFTSANLVYLFMDHLAKPNGVPSNMDFAEALGIAISKKPPLNSILLLGADLDNPLAVKWL